MWWLLPLGVAGLLGIMLSKQREVEDLMSYLIFILFLVFLIMLVSKKKSW